MKNNRFSRPTDYEEENDILLSELPGTNPLIGHYKELFSRPGNDSEVFYGEGHNIRKIQGKSKQRSHEKRNYTQRKLAKDLMESEQFHMPGIRTPSVENIKIKGIPGY